ncbi:MAG: hypothetical protein HYV93_07585 [Candidatus Rokubacteria bacterium]|nr:hypothetical protein [Candidatus Rokubacteria bacterium]
MKASLIDATTAGVFANADAVGLGGMESPEALEAVRELHRRREQIRAVAGVRMGLAVSSDQATRHSPSIHLLSYEPLAAMGVRLPLVHCCWRNASLTPTIATPAFLWPPGSSARGSRAGPTRAPREPP